MAHLWFLIIDIIVLLLQLMVITCNGFVLSIFFRHRKLRRNPSHRLLFFLVMTDFLHAIATLPYTSYLAARWNPISLDLDPYFVLISSTPLVIQLKINLTLTISIAFERTLALFFPVTYRNLSSASYARWCLVIVCILALIDLIVEFLLTPFVRKQNCAAIGCFISNEFRVYWGTSNMAMGFVVIVLTSLVIVKLRIVQKSSRKTSILQSFGGQEANKFTQANRTSAGILISSLVFVTIPSVGVGFIEMLGYSIFMTIGPFYIVGLLCTGSCNSILYIMLNREMRGLALKCGKSATSAISPPSTRIHTVTKRPSKEPPPTNTV